MSAIIIPRKHVQQPSKGSSLDEKHWLIPNLVGCWNFNDDQVWTETITGTLPVVVNTPYIATGPTGKGLNCWNGWLEHTGGFDLQGKDWSILTVGQILADSTGTSFLTDDYSTSRATVQYSLGISQDTPEEAGINKLMVGYYQEAGGWRKAVDSLQLVGGQSFIAVGTKTTQVLRLFRDGQLVAEDSNYGVATPAKADASKTYIGKRHDSFGIGNPNKSFRGTLSLVLLIDKALTGEEAAELSFNPWQIFRADPIRIYSLPSGAITINSITASNITSSGARITLGVTR